MAETPHDRVPGLIGYRFDVPTVQLILRGLGKLPHEEVRATIDQVTAIAQAQLNPPKPERRKRAPKAPQE